MAKGRSFPYREEKNGDEEAFDALDEKSSAGEGRWRPPYGLIAALCALFLVLGFGGGFGAGWAAKPANKSDPTAIPLDNNDGNGSGEGNFNIIRSFVPIDFMQNLTNDVVLVHYQQTLLLNPALQVLTIIISTYAGINNTYDPNVVRVYIMNKYRTRQDTLAKVYNVAQRLQISSDFHKELYSISTSLVDVFQYIRDNEDKMGTGAGAGGRRLLAANSATTPVIQLIKAFVKSGLQAPALQGALGDLSAIWTNIDDIVDLVYDMLDSIRDIASQTDDIEVVQRNSHPTLEQDPPPEPESIGGLADSSIKVTVQVNLPVTVDVVIEGTNLDDEPQRRRQLLDDASQLPAGFVTAQPASMPNILIPLVWHFTMYRNDDGTYGPPGIDTACDMAQRMVTIANFRLSPSKFQVYISECRASPSYQYLVYSSRDVWLACTSTGTFYRNCGSSIPGSIADFPRSVNIYVSGEQPPVDAVGYAWVPGDTVNPIQGHLGLTWSTVSTLGFNNRGSYESGASGLVHELLHHLGMDHTFSTTTCIDADALNGVIDTPVTLNPVWKQPWAAKAAMACMNTWSKALSTNWDTANQQASLRVGIPSADVNAAFDSCPDSPGSDETSNYITYTYDVCLLVLGHLTTSQIAAMHTITARTNPALYAWGQYRAQNPPPGVVTISSPPPSPPPPFPPPPSSPPPPPPVAASTPRPVVAPSSVGGTTTCTSPTARACKCQAAWQYNNVWYYDCATVPDYASKGTVCAVDLTNGNCPNARNGWWDICTKDSACPSGRGPAATPSPSPPPPPRPPPPSAAPSCGPGAPTKSGLTCTSNSWRPKNDPNTYSGCANPTNDVNGVWCALGTGQALANGNRWDYCLPGCNPTTGSSSSPPPPATPTYPAKMPCNTFSGLPDTACWCSDSYTVSFSGGGTYQRQSGCTMFAETKGAGMCVMQCKKDKNPNNGKTNACGCAS